MPFTEKTGDIAPTINEQTRKADWYFGDDGSPVFDNTKASAVACAALYRRGQWDADTRGDYGSEVYRIRFDTRATPSRLEAYATDGIAPLVDDREVANVAVRVTGKVGSRRLEISYTTPRAGAQSVRLPL